MTGKTQVGGDEEAVLFLREESVQRPWCRKFQGVFTGSESRLVKIKGTPIGLGSIRLESCLKMYREKLWVLGLLQGLSMVVLSMLHLHVAQCTTETTVLSSLANSLDFILQVAMRLWFLYMLLRTMHSAWKSFRNSHQFSEITDHQFGCGEGEKLWCFKTLALYIQS